jgi:hypothetical protein
LSDGFGQFLPDHDPAMIDWNAPKADSTSPLIRGSTNV